jgi:phosphate transport system substrate-binding protein
MRAGAFLLGAAVCCGLVGCGAGDEVTIQGSGATFPAPLYKRWFLEYYQRNPNVRVNYTPIGSGAGIRQFTAGLVQVGASDAGMSAKEIDQLPASFANSKGRRVILLPLTAGSIVLSYNVPGVGDGLRLSRKAYLGIFLRKITKWNDEEIARHNKGLKLPDTDITVVVRADSSGTTYAFTNHLTKVGDNYKGEGLEWEPGAGKSVKWKESIAAQGNDGVAALVQMTPGALGYLEFGYAELAKLPMTVLENSFGNFIEANGDTGRRALEGASIPADLQIKVPDPHEDPRAYPIVTYTWVLCRGRYAGEDARKGEVFKEVLRWCLQDGQKINASLGYIPLPPEVVRRSLAAIDEIEAAGD